MRTQGFQAEIARTDGYVVVVAHGEIDLLAVPTVQKALDASIELGGRIAMDFGDVTFIDSTGLAALVAAHHRLSPAHEAIVLLDPIPAVRRVLDISGVGALFEIRPGDHGRPEEQPWSS